MMESNPPVELTDEELSIVEFWVRLGDVLGFPRSVGRVYGLIFLRERHVTADDCVELLRISRSSAGQGLRLLVELGAIKPDVEQFSRRECFALEADLGHLISQLVQRRFYPVLQELDQRLKTMQSKVDGRPELSARVNKLARWAEKSAPILEEIRQLADAGASRQK